ncbi:MAG: peptidylprolyl isomerase [Nitrospirae bacterium]|nr:peptidylprolyl isomerase [Nitrospirota bacterium]
MKFTKAVFAIALTTLLFIFHSLSVLAEDKPVVKVNNTVLTEMDLEEILNELIPSVSVHRGMSPERRASFIPKATELLIERELLYQEALRRGMKVDKDKVDTSVEAIIKKLGGKKAFKEALKSRDISNEDFRRRVEKKFLVNDLYNIEVEQKVVVTVEEISRYYEDNKADFMRPESRRIRHILIKVDPASTPNDKQSKKKVAEEVLQKIKAGEDFAQLAWDYSDDPYRVKGGDFGIIHRGRLESPLNEIAFSLPVGSVSDVIETIYGYHIIKVEEEKQPEQLSLEDVSQKIQGQLLEKKLKAIHDAFIGDLKAGSKIEIYIK